MFSGMHQRQAPQAAQERAKVMQQMTGLGGLAYAREVIIETSIKPKHDNIKDELQYEVDEWLKDTI